MKNCYVLRFLRSGVLGLSVAVLLALGASASAQNSNNTNAARDDRQERRVDRATEDDDTDWGWLGLLGLAGLLGLMPRKRVVTPVVRETYDDRDRTPNTPPRP